MAFSFLANISQNISKIINFINLMLSFIIFDFFINNSIFDMKKKILSNEIIIYENNIIKKSLINLVEEFLIL